MPAKYLKSFLRFDLDGYLKGKELTVVELRDSSEYDGDEIAGRVVVAITKDETDYGRGPDAPTNLFEKITVKVRQAPDVSVMDRVRIVNGRGTVWGDYNNNLSIIADAVAPVAPAKPGAPKIG